MTYTATAERGTLAAAPVAKVNEAAALLGCSPRTIARMCERGDLVACKAGNQWRINRKALNAYIGGVSDVSND